MDLGVQMSRVLSLRDLRLADSLKHLNELDIIHPKNDKLVCEVLEMIGFNTKQGIDYIASNHRDLQNKTGVGFQVIGEYNVDPKYRNFVDTVDRIIICGLTDITLAKDMANLMGRSYANNKQQDTDGKSRKKPDDPRYYSEEQLLEMGYTTGDEEEEYESVEEDYELVTSQINTLNEIKVTLRGK